MQTSLRILGESVLGVAYFGLLFLIVVYPHVSGKWVATAELTAVALGPMILFKFAWEIGEFKRKRKLRSAR